MGEPPGMNLIALMDKVFDVCLDPPDGIADESDTHIGVKPSQGLHKTHVPFLDDFKRSITKVKI